MAILRIPASSYQLSSTSYLNISNPTNMYTNVDSTTYATVNHTRAQSTSYYIYVRGFDFSQIPSGSTINSVIMKVKASVNSASTSYTPVLFNGTTSLSVNFSGTIGSSATTRQVDLTSLWDTYKGYTNLGVRLQLNRSNKNTASSMYIYGCELYVDYTEGTPRTITTSVQGDGVTINPLGSTIVYEGNSFSLAINSDTEPTVTDNGVNVTSQLTSAPASGTVSKPIAAYTTSGSISGTYYQSAVGKGSDASNTTGNNYCSSSGSTADINYTFDLSEIPSGVDIISVACDVKGHLESTSASNEVAKCQLYSGTTAKGSATSFTSTTDAVINLTTGTWTRSELDNLILKFTIGYYGGNISGATLTVSYSLGDGLIYTYTIDNVQGDHTIIVSVVSSEDTIEVSLKGTSWTTKSTNATFYKKVSGLWVEITDKNEIQTIISATQDWVVSNIT